MPAPSTSLGAWLLTTASLLTGILTLALDAMTPADAPAEVELVNGSSLLSAVDGAVLALLGLVVLLRGTGRAVGWTMTGFGLFWSLDGLADAYVAWGARADSAKPFTTEAFWFVDRVSSFLPLGILLLFLIYPTGRFLPGRWRIASWAAVLMFSVASATYLVRPARVLDHPELVPPGLDLNPQSVQWKTLERVDDLIGVVLAVMVAVVIGVVATRLRRSTGLDRDRMRWLLWGVLVELMLIALSAYTGTFGFGALVFAVIVMVPAAAVTIGLVRPRLVRIDDLLGRTIVYAIVVVLVIGIDLVALAALTAVLDDALEQRQVVAVVLLLSALAYNPLREQVRVRVRRLMLGRRDDPYALVAGLASTLESTDEITDQLAVVASSVASAFGIGYVGVEIDRGRGDSVIVEHGRRPHAVRELPITYRGETIGRLVLPVRGLRVDLSDRDEQLLGDLVRQAAAAARTGLLADALQESRERLVLAREEERRRIRRDLHDGLGPSLSGAVFELESARLQVHEDPDRAVETITRTRDVVRDVIVDVRRLVHDLRPPALDDRGLAGAVQQLADARGAGRVSVVAEGVDDLPAAVEVAAYRIVAEAMTNADRHAEAAHTEVRLVASNGELVVEVRDDGRGIDPSATTGVGLLSLRERADELGGSTVVSCPPDGGTLVRSRLPLRREA